MEKELTPENLQRLGLYAFAVEMIKRGNFERPRGIEMLYVGVRAYSPQPEGGKPVVRFEKNLTPRNTKYKGA